MWSYAMADKNLATLLTEHPEGKKVMKRLLMTRQDGTAKRGLYFKKRLDGYSPPTLYSFSSSLMSHILKFEY